jgi:hypothetical protein
MAGANTLFAAGFDGDCCTHRTLCILGTHCTRGTPGTLSTPGTLV